MNTKKCNKCGEIKPLAKFSKEKNTKDGRQRQCKGCNKRYREENKVAILGAKKRYYKENKVAILGAKKQQYEENKVDRVEYQKRYNEKNKVDIAEYQKRRYEKNKGAIIEQKKHYQKERRATDPLYRLTCNIRGLIRSSFRNGGFNKKSKTAEILGCSFEEFHRHIEAQFTDDMSWQRMGEIHIDHRLPLSAANTEEELLVLNHHRNLQPLWATENMAKSDNYCPKELAAYLEKHLPS